MVSKVSKSSKVKSSSNISGGVVSSSGVTRGLQDLVDEAMMVIETLSAEDVLPLWRSEEVLLIDIRDIRELWREGTIPGSVHAPRGMLEAWVDPSSPYHRSVFADSRRLVLFCAGGVRSALATETLHRMGLTSAAHIGGGFSAWRDSGAPTEAVDKS